MIYLNQPSLDYLLIALNRHNISIQQATTATRESLYTYQR